MGKLAASQRVAAAPPRPALAAVQLPSAAAKRAHSWTEGSVVLAQRAGIVAADVADAWDALMRSLPTASPAVEFGGGAENCRPHTPCARLRLRSLAR